MHELLQFSPVVVAEGARQVGKSTLAAMVGDAANTLHVAMDDPLARQLAHDDPVGFLQQGSEGSSSTRCNAAPNSCFP